MLVKNIFTNPVCGIAPGKVDELPKNREDRLERYVELGMLEEVAEIEKDEKPKTRRGRKKEEDE